MRKTYIVAIHSFLNVGNDEEIETPVWINFTWTKGSADYYDRSLGTYLPGYPDSIEFSHADIILGGQYVRLPDQDMLCPWAEQYLLEHEDEAIESLYEAEQADREDYGEYLAEERQERLRDR